MSLLPRNCIPVLLALAISCACARHDQDAQVGLAATMNADGPAGQSSLPLPSTLPFSPRRASYVEDDLIRYGHQYSGTLFSSHVMTQSVSLLYSPSYAVPGGTFDQLAAGIFQFDIEGYDRAPLLRTEWGVAPADPASVWYGVANWDNNRWDWYQGGPDYIATLPSIEPYVRAAGDFAVAVVRAGTDETTLAAVRLAAYLPAAALRVAPAQGEPPLAVTLDASDSAATEGTLVKYEFDLGDGVFVDNGSDPVYETQYDTPGQYVVRVRVTDSQLGTALATNGVSATGGWSHTWSRGSADEIYGLTVDFAGNIYACGVSYDLGGTNYAAVWKYNAVGELLWVRGSTPTLNTNRFDACTVDADQNLILCGYEVSATGKPQGMLQKWTPDGALIWCRLFPGMQQVGLNDVLTVGTDIYTVGHAQFAENNSDAVILRVYGDGNLAWSRNWAHSFTQNDYFNCLTYRAGETLGSFEVAAAGFTTPVYAEPLVFEPIPIVLGWDENAVQLRSWRLSVAPFEAIPEAVRFTGGQIVSTKRLNLLCSYANGSNYIQILSKNKLSGSSDGGVTYFINGSSLQPTDMTIVPSIPGFAVAGSLVLGDVKTASFIGMDPAAVSASPQYQWGTVSGAEMFCSSLRTTPSGGVALGGYSWETGGLRSEVAGAAVPFVEDFTVISGFDQINNITLSVSVPIIAELTGTEDIASPNGHVAQVRYDPLTN